MNSKKVLVIVPHGDDEALMCGGTISRFVREGYNVSVAFVRSAKDTRTSGQLKDTKKAMDILNYHSRYRLRITEADLANDFLTLKDAVETVVQNVKPSIVITTGCADNHQDHKNTFRAVSVACRTHYAPFVEQILVGEINSSTDQDISSDVFVPNYFIKITEEDLKKKCLAMEVYENEKRDIPHPRSSKNIESLARVRGMAIGTEFAEAFICLKQIV